MKLFRVWRRAIVVLLMSAIGSLCFAESGVYLTGVAAADFLHSPSASQVIQTFTTSGQPIFGGIGWEAIVNHVGVGGTYLGNFQRDSSSKWWFNWYSQPIYVSGHLFGGGAFLDPFVNLGIGCAGRVNIEDTGEPPTSLLLSIFPFVAAGLNLDLNGFLVGAKISYAPYVSVPPATQFSNYPLGSVQVSLSCGVALGFRDRGTRHKRW